MSTCENCENLERVWKVELDKIKRVEYELDLLRAKFQVALTLLKDLRDCAKAGPAPIAPDALYKVITNVLQDIRYTP